MRYQWQNDASLIQDITFQGNGKKTIREAIIAAPTGLNESEKLQNLDTLLIDKGFNVSYDMQEGTPILRVSGIRAENDLINVLKENELIEGAAQTSKTETESKSFFQNVKENSLSWAATFYMLGNIATALSGIFRKDKNEISAGIGFSVGDMTMLLFGKKNAKEKHNEVMQNFGKSLSSHGYFASTGSNFAQSAVKEAPSSWGKIKKIMNPLVIPIKSISEIYAGISFAKAGVNQENTYKKIAGTALVSGFSLGLLIPEKNSSQIRDDLGVDTPEEAKEKFAALPWHKRALYKIQRQPLILSGGFAAINNLSTIAGAFDEKKNKRNLRKLEAELGIDESGKRTADTKRSYDISIVGYTQKKEVEETAYARHDRLQKLINDPNTDRSELAGLQEEFKAAKADVKHLKSEYKINTEGNMGVKGDKFWLFNLMQGVFFLAANSLYAMSSKSGSGSNDLTNRFVSSVATEALKTENAAERAEVISLAAQYAGNLEEMDFTAGEMRKKLEARVEELQANPWLKKYTETPERTLVIDGVDSIAFNLTPKQPEKEVVAEQAPAEAAEAAPSEAATQEHEAQPQEEEKKTFASNMKSKAVELKEHLTKPREKTESMVERHSPAESRGDEEWKKKTPSKGNEYSHHARSEEQDHSVGVHM